MRRNYVPSAVVETTGIVSMVDGGTSSDNVQQAVINLGLVPRSDIGVANGLVPVDMSTGKIPTSLFSNVPKSGADVDGPTHLDVEASGTYFITNFDSRLEYHILAVGGDIVSLAPDTFVYTAPMTSNTGDGFTINGILYDVVVNPIDRTPSKPTIVSPGSDVTLNRTDQLFVSSGWSTIHAVDSLQAVMWQVATDSEFTNVIINIMLTSGVMDRYHLTDIAAGQTLYVRTANKGHYGYTSPWSDARSFSRPIEQKPLTPVITNPSVDGDVLQPTVTIAASSFSATADGDTHKSSDIQVAKDSAFTDVVFSSTNDEVNKTAWSVTLPVRDTVYYVRVRYNGTSDWQSEWSLARVLKYVPNEKPQTPSILSPSVNGIIGNANITVQTSAFVATAVGDTHQASSWRFSEFADFSVLLPISERSETKLTSIVVTIPEGKTIYADVVYHGASGRSSEPSSARSVMVDYPLRPSILSPTNNATGVSEEAVVVASDFQNLSGSVGNHTVTWQLASDASFVNIVQSKTEANNNSWTIPSMNFGFKGYLRVQHVSETGQSSSWSPTVTFTVRDYDIANRLVASGAYASGSHLGEGMAMTGDGNFLYVFITSSVQPLVAQVEVVEFNITNNVFNKTNKIFASIPTEIQSNLSSLVNATNPAGQQAGDPTDVFASRVTNAIVSDDNQHLIASFRFSFLDGWGTGKSVYRNYVVIYSLATGEIVDYSGTSAPILDKVGSLGQHTRLEYVVRSSDDGIRVVSVPEDQVACVTEEFPILSPAKKNTAENYTPDGPVITNTEKNVLLYQSKTSFFSQKKLVSNVSYISKGVEKDLPESVREKQLNPGPTLFPLKGELYMAASNNLQKIVTLNSTDGLNLFLI